MNGELYEEPGALPKEAATLLEAGAARSFQLSARWFTTLAAHALPPGARPVFLLHRCAAGRPMVLFPLRAEGARLAALSAPYTCLWQPLAAADAGPADLGAAGQALGRLCRGRPPVRLDALDADWPGLPPLLAGLRAAGMAARRFDHFGNWHEPVAGLGWDAYLAGRPGALRETIRRRTARAARDPAIRLTVVDGPAGLDDGIAAYEAVHAASWKPPEPFPAFGPALMRAAAAAGMLRLGVLRHAGRPVAAQYWVVAGGQASLLKLAHDERALALSPGTVLTAALVRRLLAEERVAELDFGRGDDPYKAAWARQRRQRIGVLLADPGTPAGLAALARHAAGRLRAAWREARTGQRTGRGGAPPGAPAACPVAAARPAIAPAPSPLAPRRTERPTVR